MRVCFLALPILGCAQIAGIDKTNADNRAVTLVLDKLAIGPTVSTEPLPLDGLTASFLVADDADPSVVDSVPADPVSAGLFSAKIKTGEPPVVATLPDGAAHLYALPTRTTHVAVPVFQAADPTPPPDGAVLSLDGSVTPSAGAGDTFQFLDVGAGISADLPVAMGDLTPFPASFMETELTNLAAPLPVAAIGGNDVLLVLRYNAGALTGVADIGSQGPQQTVTALNAVVGATTVDQNLDQPIDQAAISARLAGQKPAGGALAVSYSLTAAPGFDRGSLAGVLLKSGTVAAGETSVSAGYANPFLATHMWAAGLQVVAASARQYQIGGAMGPKITLSGGLEEVTAPDGMPLAMSAAVPLSVTVGIMPVTSDGASVLVDASKPVPISMTTDMGPAELYMMELYDVATDGTVTRTLELVSDQPSWQVPASYLLPAHLYFLRAIAVDGGYGDVTTGDLSTLTPPYSIGYLDSGVFTVTL